MENIGKQEEGIDMPEKIIVRGAKVHNLKNIDDILENSPALTIVTFFLSASATDNS